MKSKLIYDMAVEEYSFNRPKRGKLLNALSYIISQAENEDNKKVFFTTVNIGHGDRVKGIIIQDINSLCKMPYELGSDFNPEYVLNGMKEATYDEYDGYCMSVLTTLDLYCAEIPDIYELIYRIREINR